MRRLVALLALAALPVAASGCSGADARRAETLLQQATVAQRSVKSEGFVVRMSFDGAGQSGGIALQGAAQLRGPGAGDFYMTAVPTGELTATPGTNFTAVRRGSTVTLREGSTTRTLSLPQAQSQLPANLNQVTHLLDITRYVKSLSVKGTSLDGRAADRIVGTLDTSGLLSKSGSGGKLLSAFGLGFTDIRVTLFIPHDTHLVEMMFVDMGVKAGGKTASLHVSVAINHVNDPLTFPAL